MLLNELLGYKKYQNLTLNQIITKLVDEHEAGSAAGHFSFVAIPKDKDFIYKCWFNDDGYQHFVDVALKHQDNPFFPKFIGKVKKIPIFFKRHANVDGFLHIIKMEKLKPAESSTHVSSILNLIKIINPQRVRIDNDEAIESELIKTIQDLFPKLKPFEDRYKRGVGKAIHDRAKQRIGFSTFNNAIKDENDRYRRAKLRSKVDSNNELKVVLDNVKQFAEAVKILRKKVSEEALSTDLHAGNFMFRGKHLVITDPFVDRATINHSITLHDVAAIESNDPIKVGRANERSNDKLDSSSELVKIAADNLHVKPYKIIADRPLKNIFQNRKWNYEELLDSIHQRYNVPKNELESLDSDTATLIDIFELVKKHREK
jgi:hypothetical protein